MTEVDSFRLERLPVVLVDVRHPALPRVVIDDLLGGQMATEHLFAKGHTRIGFVGDEPTPFGFTSSEQRRQGMARAFRRAGIRRGEGLDQRGSHGREQARELAERLLRLPDRPTAIFAASDVQAIGVLEAARAYEIRVPEDLAVIGFDDIEMAEVVGLTHHPPAAARDGREGRRPPDRRDRRGRRRADRRARAADRDRTPYDLVRPAPWRTVAFAMPERPWALCRSSGTTRSA